MTDKIEKNQRFSNPITNILYRFRFLVFSLILIVVLEVFFLMAGEEVQLLGGWLGRTTLQMATPLILAALGGMFSERSGIVNIGLEGMMLMGAFSAVAATYFTDNPWFGVLMGVASGGLLAAIHAVVCVKYKGNHIVSGTGILFLAAGFTTLMLWVIWGRRGLSDSVVQVPKVAIDRAVFEGIPGIGPVLATTFETLSPIIYWMFILVIICWYVLYKTPFGLRVRAAGEDPSALDTAGVSVEWTRAIAVIISGCLAGLGGAYLSIGFSTAFGKAMTRGRGFIALAALIFGNWTPLGVFISGMFFGFLNGLQYAIVLAPGLEFLQDWSQFVQMIPYLLVVVALAGIRKSIPPKSVGQPYEKERKG